MIDILQGFNPEKLARDSLAQFMLYTDPFANSPGGGYVLKEFHRKIINVLEKVERGEIKKLMINVPAQHGKQIANYEQVFTTKGRKKHGDLHFGDYVYSPEGKPIMVLGESKETQSEYRITFSNGQTIDCHGNHERLLSKNKHDFKVYETKKIAENYIRKEGKNIRRIYRLPRINHIELDEQELLIDPYTLGFWLGDGKTNGGGICSPKDELNKVIERISGNGLLIGNIWSNKDYDLDNCTILGLQTKLKELGLFGNKYIPERYIYSSIKQRLELLAGLIDSDGAVFNDKRWNSGSRVTITNTNKNIIDGVQNICDLMGWRTYNFKCLPKSHDDIYPRKTCYQISFNPDMEISTVIERKRIIPSIQKHIGIDKVEKIEGLGMGKCIEVEGGVYLVGSKFIPTHNSSLSSVGYAGWTLGRNPYQHIGLISYSADLSQGFSRKTRELLRGDLYKKLFGDILSVDSQGVEEWNTNKGGSYCAVGVGGSYTGKPATKIIIDDPHKDHEEAQSKIMREKVWNWYLSVATTRITSLTSVIIIMTRWHEDDLCGKLLEAEPDERTVLNIPVFNEDGTVIRPERHPKEMIDKKRQLQGEPMFQAMYMGDPINEGGGAFKQEYFQYYEKGEIFDEYGVKYVKDLQVVTFIDPAISQKQSADDTSIVTVGLDKKNNNVYLIDIRRGKMLPDEIIDNVFNVYNTFHPQKMGIETNAFQKMLEIEIRKEMKKRNTFFLLEGQTSTMNKEAKIISALQPRYSNITIFHQKRGKNVDELEAQLLKFPNGKHDDCVDATSMAIMMLSGFMNVKSDKSVKANWLNNGESTGSMMSKIYRAKHKPVKDYD